MPTRKQPKPPEPPWHFVLERLDAVEDRIERGVESVRALVEDIRSDNRATAEALDATQEALERRIERLSEQAGSRDAALDLAIRDLKLAIQQNSGDIRDLKVSVQQNGVDIRDLAARVAALARIEERVAALEKRLA